MSKQLIIAEKPSVGKEIARVLGATGSRDGYIEGNNKIVTWAYGHLVTHAGPDEYDKKYADWHLDDLPIIPEHMKLTVIRQTSKQYKTVKKLLDRGDVSEVVIATDAGREGELVARWILEKAGCRKTIKRLWISSVTDKAIRDGFNHLKPGKDYENLYKAAVARAEGDWIVGINATRALTTKFGTPLSCGRVQTPTLNIVKTREDQIRKFVPKTFYGLQATTSELTFIWKNKANQTQSFEKAEIDQIHRTVEGKPLVVTSIKESIKKEYAPKLYDLTTLQKEAFDRYGYSPKRTLSIMQSLYEKHKVLTYPRTDSNYLTSDMVGTLTERLRTVSDPDYRPFANQIIKEGIKAGKHFVDNDKVSDHHAIILTEEALPKNGVDREEWTIYEMVLVRFLSVLLPACESAETLITVSASGQEFTAKGTRNIKLGFKALPGMKPKNHEVPKFEKGAVIEPVNYKVTSGQTSPPKHFNEGSLLAAMENPAKFMAGEDESLKHVLTETGGLGTVATRADIIEKLFNSQLIKKSGSNITVTSKGRQLLDVAPSDLKSPKLTAEWELTLEKIAKGKSSSSAFVNELKTYTRKVINDIKGSTTEFKHDNLTNTPCPDCGKKLLNVETKNGKSLVCSDRECGYRKNMERSTNARCPECKKKMVLRAAGDDKMFVCKCGFREKLSVFEKKKKEQGNKGGKRDYIEYQKKQAEIDAKKAAESNPFAKALAGLNLKE